MITVDTIFTKTGTAAIAQSASIEIVASDATRRPFVTSVECQASAGELDCNIGSLKICSKGRNRHGLWVGAFGDAVTIDADGSSDGEEYIITAGYMRADSSLAVTVEGSADSIVDDA